MDTVVQSGNAGSQDGHKTLILDTISLITRLAMAAVWIISGISKLRDSLQTQQAINAYEILPRDVISPLAAGLPVFEIALGVLLLLGIFLRPAAVISIGLLTVFIIAIISAWARGLSIDCGCFGGDGANPNAGLATYLTEIGRDLGFIVLSVWTVWRPFKRFALHP